MFSINVPRLVSDLRDVVLTSLTDQDVLTYDTGTGRWVNKAAAGGVGSGDVVGPGSATDNSVPRFDGTTGKLLQGSRMTMDDDGNVTMTRQTGQYIGVTMTGSGFDLVLNSSGFCSGFVRMAFSGYSRIKDAGDFLTIDSALDNSERGLIVGIVELRPVTSLGTPTSGTGRIGVIAGEVNVVDSSGNVSVISPHAKDAPTELYRIAPGVDQMRRHVNPYRGVVQFVAEDGREVWETFDEYNARQVGEPPLLFTDWNEVEAARVAARVAEIVKWQEQKAAHESARAAWLASDETKRGPEPQFTEPEPQPYLAQPRPDWAHQVTRAELDAVVPVSVMAHQLRVQLIMEGIDPDMITAAIAGIPDATTRKVAAAQWEYAPTIRRDHPLVASLAVQLALSSERVDEIFRKATKL